MGRGDSRLTAKMRRKRGQKGKKIRLKRRAEATKQARKK